MIDRRQFIAASAAGIAGAVLPESETAYATPAGEGEFIIWHQGESDEVHFPGEAQYQAGLRKLVANMRKACPRLKIAIGKLSG